MNSTLLLSQISRSDTFPKKVQVSPNNNSGYISIVLTNWTDQMFYELPYIEFSIYTKSGNTYTKYMMNSICVKTYVSNLAIYPETNICHLLKNIPDSCYIEIKPFFDDDAISARNMLIENGIESGNLWTTKTGLFNINISFLTD
jgi:hypothetical protein